MKIEESTLFASKVFEDRVLECLNAEQTVHGLLLAAINLLTEAVKVLILQVFRKDDYAVKYAIEPLLKGSGPLGELAVRLKLIYALGLISRAEYEDAELLMALLDQLNRDRRIYQFTDDEILGPLSLLHDMVLPLPYRPTHKIQDPDGLLYTMQQQRYQQMIRSSLVLAVNALVVRIMNKKAF